MKEQKLLSYLGKFCPLNEASISILRDSLQFETYARGQTLWNAGEKPEEKYFLLEGLIRLYSYNEDGDDITVHFSDAGNFLADLDSFNSDIPSLVTAVAERDTEVIAFHKPTLERLAREIPEWSGLLARITEKALFDKVKIRSDLFQREARDRYLSFLTYFPNVANHVKAAHVASFLGISQYTLSHIKKELLHSDFLRNSKN
ncbi:Crp/Fnr family transcriptional regulator [Dawidia soli]|uniref:Crp/Fnr family transcriptional regulator n=1 Tax=Dawidia soli TaxID=2782352 RepID=A0AAP2DGL6_9BACT|nr:Crp/Fnr family transcriptional regulator [Dawidia soli]MBT1689007.1 Crp/Fnr family transcriptional regulator [Dawidia soli]